MDVDVKERDGVMVGDVKECVGWTPAASEASASGDNPEGTSRRMERLELVAPRRNNTKYQIFSLRHGWGAKEGTSCRILYAILLLSAALSGVEGGVVLGGLV